MSVSEASCVGSLPTLSKAVFLPPDERIPMVRTIVSVDFRGLGGLQFIGNPKQPTFTVCQLVNGVYQQQQYRLGDVICSYLFPSLQLKLDDVMP